MLKALPCYDPTDVCNNKRIDSLFCGGSSGHVGAWLAVAPHFLELAFVCTLNVSTLEDDDGGCFIFYLKRSSSHKNCMCMGLVRSTSWQELTAFLVDCELLAAGVDIQGIASRISSELAMTLKEHFSGMQCRCRVDNLNAKDAEREGGKGMAALRLLGLYCICSTGSYNCFGMLQEKSASIRA